MSLEAEQALVGSALLSAERYDAVTRLVAAEDFSDPDCRLAFEIIAGLSEIGRQADAISVGSALDRSSHWRSQSNGSGVDWCMALVECTSSYRVIDAYAEVVRESAISRRLTKYACEVRTLADDADIPGMEKLAEAQGRLTPLMSQSAGDEFSTPGEAAREALGDLLEKMDNPDQLTGISTGWRDFDAMTGGMQDADLIVYAGRPSQGKTAGAMNIATHVAASHPVLVFSLEMSKKALSYRMMSSLGRVDLSSIINARIDEAQQTNMQAAVIAMRDLDMRIDDRSGLHVDQLCARARVAARSRMPRLIVVDYLTKLTGKGENRTAQVGYCAQRLKDLAKELNCPLICLAQLNRGVDSRSDARPRMSDLRDSGEIEQEADIVMFNYLDEKYDDESPRRGICELLIEKHRNGPTGAVWLDWQGPYQTFSDRNQAVPALNKKASGNERLRALSGGKDRAANGSEVAF